MSETIEIETKRLAELYLEAQANERNRIINLLIELNAIRRDALGYLVAFNTHGTEVIYLTGLEQAND